MVIFTEEELKHVLDDKGFRFGDRFPSVGFIVTFIDVGTGAQLSSSIFRSPIDGVANLVKICEAVHRKPDDVKIVLDFAFDYNTRQVSNIDVEIDKYIYFDKPKELSISDKSSEQSK